MASAVARTLMAVGTLTALAAGSAHASDVHWSVGINAPIAPGVAVGTVISNHGVLPVPVIAPAPVYVPAPPVVVAPPVYGPPVYAAPVYGPPVYAAPVYAPRVVYGAPVWVGGRWARYPVHHGYAHPAAWHPGYGHAAPAPRVPTPRMPTPRMPGREIRY
jgi:hypothetical protein